MPIYTYECASYKCNGVDYLVSGMNEQRPTWKKCSLCGKRAMRTYTTPQLSIFKPYTTPDITGTDVEVTSPRQEDALCKRHGITRLGSDDMKGDRSSVTKRRKKRWDDSIKALGSMEQQYQKHCALGEVNSPSA